MQVFILTIYMHKDLIQKARLSLFFNWLDYQMLRKYLL